MHVLYIDLQRSKLLGIRWALKVWGVLHTLKPSKSQQFLSFPQQNTLEIRRNFPYKTEIKNSESPSTPT
jgi:hypothetical protein